MHPSRTPGKLLMSCKRKIHCHEYPHVIFVRANDEEKEKIKGLAQASRLSLSRFLVRLATEEKPPPTAEERAEFLMLLTQLRMISTNLSHLSRTVNTAWAKGITIPISTEELKGVVSAVKVTTQSIRRRL